MDFNLQKSVMKFENVSTAEKLLDIFPKETCMEVESVPKFNTSMDCLSHKTDKKIEDENKRQIDIFPQDADMKIEDETTKQMECFPQETDMKIEYGAIKQMDCFPSETDWKIEDSPTTKNSLDSFSQKMDKKIGDELTFNKEMNSISKEINMITDDELAANISMNYFTKETEEKLDVPRLSKSMEDFSQETEIKVNVPTPNKSVEYFLQKPDIAIEDEPTQITSTHDLKPVFKIRKRKQSREEPSLKPYILRVKKAVIPDLKLSSKTLEVLDNLISNVYEMYCCELQGLFSHRQKKTLSAKTVESATKLCLPGRRKHNAMIYARNLPIFQKD